jgi:transposase
MLDNPSSHHSSRVQAMHEEAGVLLEYPAPYYPTCNPIEQTLRPGMGPYVLKMTVLGY